MSARASDLFFQAIAKRRISLKAVARIAGCSPISVERLRLGHTRKLDIELVVKFARSLPDAQEFMREVLPDFVPSGMPASDISELRGHIIDIKHMVAGARGRRETPIEAGWVLDDGSFAPAPDGLDATAARLAGLSPQGRGDIVDYVCRGFGWIAFGAAGDERSIRFDRAHVDPKACLQALRVLEESATEHFAVKAGPEPASLETRDDVRRIFERRIRAASRVPADWTDVEVPIADTDRRLRAILEGGFYADPAGHAVRLLSGGESSLFAVVAGEAVCYHIGSKFRAPTRTDTGIRVLDRTRHVHYAALVDRHIVRAAQERRPTVSRVGVDFGFRRTLYERLALPFEVDGNTLVLTTSRIIEDTENTTLN
jgi:hypothetical protein